MSINYVLIKNHFTEIPDDYWARVQFLRSVGMEEVIDRIIKQGSTVNKPDILGVLEDFFCAIEDFVLLGMRVCTPIANFGVGVKGRFDGLTDSFDPNRHRIVGRVQPGARFNRTVREKARPVKQQPTKKNPHPQKLVDCASGSINDLLTPGRMAELEGHLLSFDPTDPVQGIFFLAEDDSETRVEIVGTIKPSGMSFEIPALTSGTYRLEVRAITYHNSEVRSGTLEAPLTVS
jgi:hypothetical protein